jgi:hypothetical protein
MAASGEKPMAIDSHVAAAGSRAFCDLSPEFTNMH